MEINEALRQAGLPWVSGRYEDTVGLKVEIRYRFTGVPGILILATTVAGVNVLQDSEGGVIGLKLGLTYSRFYSGDEIGQLEFDLRSERPVWKTAYFDCEIEHVRVKT